MMTKNQLRFLMLAWDFSSEDRMIVEEALEGGFIATANIFAEALIRDKKQHPNLGQPNFGHN